jgi:hypothetical protein
MYSTNYISDVNVDGPDEDSFDFSRFFHLRNFLKDEVATHGDVKLLDYGCGADTQVLLTSRQLRMACTGVELDEATRGIVKLTTSLLVLSPGAALLFEKRFDIIFLGDLPEHTYNPSELPSNLTNLLSNRGSFFIQGLLEGARTLSNYLLTLKAQLNSGSPSTFPPYYVSLANFQSFQRLLNYCGLEVTLVTIREPFWPAKSFEPKESFRTLSDFVFSVSKLCDILVSRFYRNYPTRIYCVAQIKQFNT